MLENLFLFLVNRSISAGWLILAVIILRLFLKRAPRRIVCFLWILAAVRLLIPFSPESAFSLIPSRDTFRLAEKEGMATLPLTDIAAGEKMQEDFQNVTAGYGRDRAGQRVLRIQTGFEKLDSALEGLLEKSQGKTVSDLSKAKREATETKDERESSSKNTDALSGILADENPLGTINSVGDANPTEIRNSADPGNLTGTVNSAGTENSVGTGNSAGTENSVETGNFAGIENSVEIEGSVGTKNSVGTGNPTGTENSSVIGNPSETRNPAENGILAGTNPEIQASPLLLEIASCVWLAGTVVLLSGSLLSYLLLRRKVRIYVEKTPGVRYCDEIDTPFILGLLCPKIYMPSNLGTAEKEYVLAHERAHLESWDSGRKAIGYVLLSIYWMNPLIWAGYALFCRDLEIACDERVIEGKDLAYRKAYAMALLFCSVPGRRITAYPLAFGEVSVKKRIRTVLGYRKPRVWITAAGVFLCGIVLLCFLTDPEGSGETFAQNSHGAEQTPLVSSGKWEDAYRNLYQTWTTGGGEEDAPFVQLHDFDGDEIPEMMLLDGTETLHIYSYSAEEKRVDTVAKMSVMGAVYCWGNVIAARTPEYHTVYFTYADGRFCTGNDQEEYKELDQVQLTDEEFGAIFPVFLKGNFPGCNHSTNEAEDFIRYELESIGLKERKDGFSPFCFVSELEDLEDYYSVIDAFIVEEKGSKEGRNYTTVRGYLWKTAFADIFFEDDAGNVEQTVQYRFYNDNSEEQSWNFSERSGSEEIKWKDANQDGNMDIWIDLGILGKVKIYGCLIYDPQTDTYQRCEGFEKIYNPVVLPGGLFGGVDFGASRENWKYEITEEPSVELVGILFSSREDEYTEYMEEHYENGMTVYHQDKIKRRDVDHSFWAGWEY